MHRNFKKIVSVIISLFIITILSNCKSGIKKNISDLQSFQLDTSIVETKNSDILFSIPSPYQTSSLLEKYKIYFNISLLPSIENSEKCNTNFTRSLLLGAYGADLSYLIIFDKKDLLLRYSYQIDKLMSTFESDMNKRSEFSSRFDSNINKKDSLLFILTEMYKQCDLFLKQNDRSDVSVLIVTGGWIESFYLLTNIYNNNQQETLFNIITYQNEILELLIKLLSPYYDKSPQYTKLIDSLVKIAYEFDLMDKKSVKTQIEVDTIKHFSFIKNKMAYKFTGSKPNDLSVLATELRSIYIQ